jgi:hypothetical protein
MPHFANQQGKNQCGIIGKSVEIYYIPHPDHWGAVKASDPVLQVALNAYHHELLMDNGQISRQLLKDHKIIKRYFFYSSLTTYRTS